MKDRILVQGMDSRKGLGLLDCRLFDYARIRIALLLRDCFLLGSL